MAKQVRRPQSKVQKIRAASKKTYQHKLLYIDDNVLTSLGNNNVFLRDFPFLRLVRSANKGKSGCGGCGSGASNKKRAEVYQAVKRNISQLSAGKKNRLKELLKTKQIRVVYRNAGGKTIQLTF